MEIISTFQKLRRFFLYFAILLFVIPAPTLQAGAVDNIQILEQQVEKLPLKPKLEKKKKIKKKRFSPKNNQSWRAWLELFLIFSFPISMILGAILFGIGVGMGIFGLWLTGLILFGTFNLLMWAIILGAKIKNRANDGLGAAILIIALGIIAIINFILFLGFLIWGLIVASPLIWLFGLGALVMAIADIIVAIISV